MKDEEHALEMEEKKAATLTDIMAASARKKDPS